MALTIVATPGAANANSYVTLAEALAYFEARAPLSAWDDADSQEALLVMATRVIDAYYTPGRTYMSGKRPYFRVRPSWTGAPASETQALAWPRTGMYNRNGFAIASTVIPQELKDAVCELAGQLATSDRTLDIDAAVQGITAVKAGSVGVNFKSDGMITSKPLPDAVMLYIVPSWLTDESLEFVDEFDFEVL